MNKLVKQHYPASKLPADLRVGLKPDGIVTVTVVEEDAEVRKPLSRDDLRSLLEAAQSDSEGRDVNAAVDRIRALRDEWDD